MADSVVGAFARTWAAEGKGGWNLQRSCLLVFCLAQKVGSLCVFGQVT